MQLQNSTKITRNSQQQHPANANKVKYLPLLAFVRGEHFNR